MLIKCEHACFSRIKMFSFCFPILRIKMYQSENEWIYTLEQIQIMKYICCFTHDFIISLKYLCYVFLKNKRLIFLLKKVQNNLTYIKNKIPLLLFFNCEISHFYEIYINTLLQMLKISICFKKLFL